jgi:chromosome segregation ATPase
MFQALLIKLLADAVFNLAREKIQEAIEDPDSEVDDKIMETFDKAGEEIKARIKAK